MREHSRQSRHREWQSATSETQSGIGSSQNVTDNTQRPAPESVIVLNWTERANFIDEFGEESLTRVGPVNSKKKGKLNRYVCN